MNNIENITHSAQGHTLHHHGVFDPSGEWIVFDGRNDDTKIGETATIGVVNVKTGEEKLIYQTANATVYGPGVGAASFSPQQARAIFIHGLPSANAEKPYAMSRRTGVAIDLEKPHVPIPMDARQVTAPYQAGTLRGGTHSHAWSGDGKMLSFTYNDEFVEADLRVVGVMFEQVLEVPEAEGNNSGTMYSAVVTDITAEPEPGSDQIKKAFDECWVGVQGYTNSSGQKVPYAIAYQGNVLNEKGDTITEIFVVDIDKQAILADKEAVGKVGERPRVPQGIKGRRITKTEKGLSTTRHWLRSSPDGKFLYALAKDTNNLNQIIEVDILSGNVRYLTQNTFNIDFTFNLDKEGNRIAFVGNGHLHVLDLKTLKVSTLTSKKGKLVGAPSFSPNGNYIVFNAYLPHENGGEFLQIVKVKCR